MPLRMEAQTWLNQAVHVVCGLRVAERSMEAKDASMAPSRPVPLESQ
jgi:hypothetical protein